MKRKKLLLISLDALCESDFETVRNLPNFSKIITEGAYCCLLYTSPSPRDTR